VSKTVETTTNIEKSPIFNPRLGHMRPAGRGLKIRRISTYNTAMAKLRKLLQIVRNFLEKVKNTTYLNCSLFLEKLFTSSF
jgi:hypothetical protein